ncbi:MAG: hypothetical protein JW973_03450 [Bacteroidales bacterium]|nr:hypothetical protein [Bacteroidales bacterium]
MVIRNHKSNILFLAGLISIFFVQASGQESNTMYFMKGVPQSYQLNPATQPCCREFLGFPAACPIQFYFENSAFSLEDIIFPAGDSLISFLHPDADKNDFLDNLAAVNHMQLYISSNLLSVGARSNEMYYTFDIAEKIYSRLMYNDDLVDFVLTGNKRGERFDFSNTNVDLTSYLEFATGISRIVNERLTVGARLKLLYGQVNISSNNKEISLITEEDWTINSNLDMRICIPGLKIPVDENGEFDLDTVDFEFDALEIGQAAFSNMGLGLDLGMHYALTDKIRISASLIDLAGIRWSANPYSIRQDASYVYRGIEYDPSDSTDMMDNFLDSLKSVFSFTAATDPYYTLLPVKLFVGGTYQIIDQIGIGILSRTEYYKKKLREQLTLSVNFTPCRMLAFSFSYTIMNNTYNNIGLGLSTRLGPFSFYLVTDNLPTAYATEQSGNMIIPYRASVLNLRLGLNLVFGCREVKKKLRDLPLVY